MDIQKYAGVKIIVYGKVQGVGFRYATRLKANALSVYGSVRNLATGEVEIIAVAEVEVLKKFIKFCQNGPEFATVSDIDTENLSETEVNRYLTDRNFIITV